MGMINIGAGLSALGESVAKTAGGMAIEQQRANMEEQKLRLADQLSSDRAWSAPGVKQSVALADIGLAQKRSMATAFTNLMGGGGTPAASTTPTTASDTTTSPAPQATSTSDAAQPSPDASTGGTSPAPDQTSSANPPALPQGFDAIPPSVKTQMQNAYALSGGNPEEGLKVYTKWVEEQNKVFDQRKGSQLKTGAGVPVGSPNQEDKVTPITEADRTRFGLAKDDVGYMVGEKPVLLHEKTPPNVSVDRDLLFPALKRLSEGTATEADHIILQQLKPGSNSLLTDEAKINGAWYFIQNNKLPVGARDRASAAAIMNTIAELKPANISNEAWMLGLQNNSLALHAKNAAAAQGGKMQLATTINEDTVINSINIMNNLLKKGVAGPTDITDVNAVAQWLKRETNDQDAVNLKNAISTISNEYARVMTGQTGGAASSDGARNEAAQRLLLGYTKGTLQSAADLMVKEMQGRSKAYERAINQLTGGTYGGVAPTQEYNSPITTTPGKGASADIGPPPPGIDPEDWKHSTPEQRLLWK